jgi:hypothetical protein
MKNIILSALLTGAMVTSAHAQIAAGTTMLGGNFTYWKSSNEVENSQLGYTSKTTNRQFNINPVVGQFIAENLAVGIQAMFSSTESKYHNPIFSSSTTFNGDYQDQIQKGRTLSVGPMLRYYKFVNEKAAFYGQVSMGYQNNYQSNYTSAFSNGGYSTPSTSGSTRSEGFYGQVSPGFVFFPLDKLGLELALQGISFGRVTDKNDAGKSVDTYLGAGFSLSNLQMGASFYLGRN